MDIRTRDIRAWLDRSDDSVRVLFKYKGLPLDCDTDSVCWKDEQDIDPKLFPIIEEFWKTHEFRAEMEDDSDDEDKSGMPEPVMSGPRAPHGPTKFLPLI